MKNEIIFCLLLTTFIASCSDDRQLQSSIFVADETAKGLPEYSEQGYNTFGAYYDRDTFVSSGTVPLKIIVTNGEMAFSFIGNKASSGELSLIIKRKDFLPATYADLISLGNTSLMLTAEQVEVSIKKFGIEYAAQVLNGEIVFKKAKNVLVDTKQIEVILSGTFELQAIVDGEPISITDGRFDVGVGKENFFEY